MSDFHGVVPALITPYDSSGEFNEAAYRQLMEYGIKAGADGFWITGGTGESVLLAEDEVVRIAQVSADQSAGRAKSIVHVGALTTSAAVRMATAARQAGVDAVSCVPPFFYRMSDQAVVDHYRAVADAGDMPFFVYNQPKYTGVEITPSLMEMLIRAVPQLAGVKHSAPDFHNIRRFSAMGIAVFTGSGSLFLPALAAGAVGVVDGPLTVSPEIWVDLYHAYREGDMQQAQNLQERGRKLIELVGRFGMQAACKVLASARFGMDCGIPRLPIPTLTDVQQSELLQAAREIGVLETPQATDRV
jgi:N-acetylneuraminate lyase